MSLQRRPIIALALAAGLGLFQSTAAFADSVMLLGNGGAIASGPRDAALTAAHLERTYGIAMERLALPNGGVRLFVRP